MGLGSIIGGVLGAGSSLLGAGQISGAANSATDWTKQVYQNESGQLAPWINTGQSALYSLASLLGLGGATQPGAATGGGGTAATAAGTPGSIVSDGRNGGVQIGGSALAPAIAAGGAAGTPTTGTISGGTPQSAFQSFTNTPYYQFPLQQAMLQLQRSNASRGLLGSGATAKDILQQSTGYASQGLGSYLSALSNVAGGGQSAAQSLGSTGVGVSGNVLNGSLTGATAGAAGLGLANQSLFGQSGSLTPWLNSLNSSSYGAGSPGTLQQAWGAGSNQYVP